MIRRGFPPEGLAVGSEAEEMWLSPREIQGRFGPVKTRGGARKAGTPGSTGMSQGALVGEAAWTGAPPASSSSLCRVASRLERASRMAAQLRRMLPWSFLRAGTASHSAW